MYKRTKQQLNTKLFSLFYNSGKKWLLLWMLGNRMFDFVWFATVWQMDASFCSIEQILVCGRLCSITEPSWTIGVRWGLISEHSIRYTRVYCNICIIFSEHRSPILKRFLNSTFHWLVDLRWCWQGWSRWLISGDVSRCIVICWEVKFPVITSKKHILQQ